MSNVKHLLPQVPKYFKANLHTHSTVSDGKLTPQETRDAYKAKGYSILALTDHSVMVDHQQLNQEDFLMLTGVEVDIEEDAAPGTLDLYRCRHLCLISRDPHRQWIPFRDPNPIPNSVPYVQTNEAGGLERVYDYGKINEVIAESSRQGCLVTYNHPEWSLENYPDYADMEGLWAMEYRNSSSAAVGQDEDNSMVYQDFLKLGKGLMPVMADDTHTPVSRNGYPVLGNSWNMIGAPELTYESVIAAMERGDLYGSCGPEITGLTLEGTVLRITCSPAVRVKLLTQCRFARQVLAGVGESLTQAEFDLERWMKLSRGKENAFVRLAVTAADGTYAVTRAYWMKELEG